MVTETPDKPRKPFYVIKVFTSQETQIKTYIEQEIKRLTLEDEVGEILIPTETVVEMREGKKRVRTKLFFPGYLVVEMLLNDKTKHLVQNTPGFLGFAGNANDPQPLRPDEVDRILGRAAEKRTTITQVVPFHVDEAVKITDGPFKDFVGSIKEINQEKHKLKVLVSIFGRSTPVEVDFLQVTTNISA